MIIFEKKSHQFDHNQNSKFASSKMKTHKKKFIYERMKFKISGMRNNTPSSGFPLLNE